MNLVVQCSGCGALFRVMQVDGGADVSMLVGDQSEFWPDKYACPRCEAKCLGLREEQLTRSAHTIDIVDLTAEEMFAALHGLGLPGEEFADYERVYDLLISQRIMSVEGSTVAGTHRCRVDRVVLANGTTLHFGSSTHGAIIYRIVPKHSYVKALEEKK